MARGPDDRRGTGALVTWRGGCLRARWACSSLLSAAGLVALVLLRQRVGSGPPAGHLVGEVFVTTLALFLLASDLLVMAQRFRW